MQGAKCFFAPVSIPHAKSLEVKSYFLELFSPLDSTSALGQRCANSPLRAVHLLETGAGCAPPVGRPSYREDMPPAFVRAILPEIRSHDLNQRASNPFIWGGSGGHAALRDFVPLPLHRSCLPESKCRGWSCERADEQVAEEVEMRFSRPRGS